MNMSVQFENDLEKLAVITNIPQLTKPYNVATVISHLKKIKTSHPALYKRLDRVLAPYSSKLTLSSAKLSVSYSDSDSAISLPNQMGSTTEQDYRFKAHGHWQNSPWVGVYAGINTSNERTLPSGSILAVGTYWAQLDIGYKERWWSPFKGSAQMISTNAETIPSIGISSNTSLELFGTGFNYDIFVGQTSRQAVLYQGEWSDKNKPYFSGMHFSFQPTEWWSIGVNRMFQFGGGERDPGPKDILRALLDPRGADNTSDQLSQDQETGNQIASIVSRMNFRDFSVYMEFAGEDTSNNKAWQLGNTAINAGVYFQNLIIDDLSIKYEYSEWQEGWYSHHLYSEGLTNENHIIGSSHHQPNYSTSDPFSIPGNSHFISASHQFKNCNFFELKITYLRNQSSPNSNILTELLYSTTFRKYRLESSFQISKNFEKSDYYLFTLSLGLE